MRGESQPGAENAPAQPLLFATGSEDRILEASRTLAHAAPDAAFFEIPGRNHFNAPTARAFREASIDFLGGSGTTASLGGVQYQPADSDLSQAAHGVP